MKLSVVIVNYNVRHFLDQCLASVAKAINGMQAEVFVVDNNSVDGSVEMVAEKYPWTHLIANKENTGFSKANNQAMRLAKGQYVLLLNPDTVVEEDTFHKCVNFMDAHPDAGGLGVKMIDGKGNFLPESKRGLPSPSVAFYKVFGLSALFPKSRIFGKYHLGYLDKNKTHEVEVLAGAYMLMRKETLDKVGLLDETFFMYGEDIDLSYRITQGGYKNYYFPEARIIHYKGESTKKSSVNYVIVFYNAMIIFASKHFSQGNARLFSFLINIAIYLRAGVALLNRFIARIALPAIDGVVFFAGLYFLTGYWETKVKVLNYPPVFLSLVVPTYVLIWLFSIYLSGGYDKPLRIIKSVRGIATGTIFILVVYALLSEEYRFSRALIIIGTAWASLAVVVLRLSLNMTGVKQFLLERSDKKNMVIVAGPEEGKRVLSLLQLSGSPVNFIGFVSPGEVKDAASYSGFMLGNLGQLKDITELYQVSEVIFCAGDLTSQAIISQMLSLSKPELEYKIAPPESLFIIGSNSIDDQGDLYLVDVNAITNRTNKRNKRLFDIAASVIMLPLFPVLMFKVSNPAGWLMNILRVLGGKHSWVGLINNKQQNTTSQIKPGILHPAVGLSAATPDEETAQRLNAIYARDYKVEKDFSILMRAIKELGRKV
jgi:GT2 family glycosyltransferase